MIYNAMVREIREWVMQEERYTQPGLGKYGKQSMKKVKFEDVKFEVNKMYLFSHQQGCQHPFMVRDIRYVFFFLSMLYVTPSFKAAWCTRSREK